MTHIKEQIEKLKKVSDRASKEAQDLQVTITILEKRSAPDITIDSVKYFLENVEAHVAYVENVIAELEYLIEEHENKLKLIENLLSFD